MILVARRIEHPLDMAGQRSHEADASKKIVGPPRSATKYQGLHCGGSTDSFRKPDDEIAGVKEGDRRAPVGEERLDRRIHVTIPCRSWWHPFLSNSISVPAGGRIKGNSSTPAISDYDLDPLIPTMVAPTTIMRTASIQYWT
jgi:hypothetical protein